MSLGSLLRMTPQPPREPVRPDGFRETVDQRTVPVEPDYPSDVEAAVELDTPDRYGYGPGESEQDRAVGVYLTAPIPSDRPLNEWSTGTYGITSVTANLAGQDRKRTRALIRNHSEDQDVYLLRNRSDQAFAGFLLEPGRDIEMMHNSNVWAVCPGGTAQVSVLLEWTVEENNEG